jgi:hypothetical protein
MAPLTILETSQGSLQSRGSGSQYLVFALFNQGACFWEAIKELNEAIVKAGVTGHQILINQDSFVRQHSAHVQVRLASAQDMEKLVFNGSTRAHSCWADEMDDEP